MQMKVVTITVLVGSTAALACGGGEGSPGADVGSVSQASTVFSSQVTSLATADATIRDGSYADQNFGSDKTLGVKKASTSFNRTALLQFDATPFEDTSNSGVSGITLQLYGSLNQSDKIVIRAVGGLPSWYESTVTWNKIQNGPKVVLEVEDTKTITSTGNHWWSWNVDRAVHNLLDAGYFTTFVVELQSTTTSSTVVSFKSRESGSSVAPRLVGTRTTIMPTLDSGGTSGCGSDSRIGKSCTGTVPSSCVGLTGSVTGKYICSGSKVTCEVKQGRDYCIACGGPCGDCASASCTGDETCGPGSVCNTYPGQGYCGPACRLEDNLCWAPGTRPKDGDVCISAL